MTTTARTLFWSVLAILLASVLSCGTCLSAPTVFSVSPNSTIAGGNQFLLTVDGVDFNRDSLVLWNGSFRVTKFVNSQELAATITAMDIARPGTFTVRVFNPPEAGTTFTGVGVVSTTPCSGKTSNAAAFTVNP